MALVSQQKQLLATSQSSDPISADYIVLGTRFRRLVEETHLPFLEIKLYEKYFLEPRLPERIEGFKTIIQKLEDHRAQTVRVLALCSERELIVNKMFQVIESYKKREMTTLQLQTALLRCLYHHQQLALGVVEGVQKWREDLTRAYPFTFKGDNCLVSILSDCERVEKANLSSVLPLQLRRYPLCSNVTAITLFSEEFDNEIAHSKATASPKAPQQNPHRKTPNISLDSPRKSTSSKKATSPSTPRGDKTPSKSNKSSLIRQSSMAERLQAAEAALVAEPLMQVHIATELSAIAEAGRFVPLLRIPHIVPDCITGLVVSDREWEAQMRVVVAEMKEKAEKEAALGPTK